MGYGVLNRNDVFAPAIERPAELAETPLNWTLNVFVMIAVISLPTSVSVEKLAFGILANPLTSTPTPKALGAVVMSAVVFLSLLVFSDVLYKVQLELRVGV